MDQQTLIQMRRIYAEVAGLVAIEARVAGMQAENQGREPRGEALAYNDQCFFEEAEKADAIRQALLGDG